MTQILKMSQISKKSKLQKIQKCPKLKIKPKFQNISNIQKCLKFQQTKKLRKHKWLLNGTWACCWLRSNATAWAPALHSPDDPRFFVFLTFSCVYVCYVGLCVLWVAGEVRLLVGHQGGHQCPPVTSDRDNHRPVAELGSSAITTLLVGRHYWRLAGTIFTFWAPAYLRPQAFLSVTRIQTESKVRK